MHYDGMAEIKTIKFLLYTFFFVIGIYIYTAIHELAHYITAIKLGYSAIIKWSFLIPTVHVESISNIYDIFKIMIIPYALSLFLLMLIFILYFFVFNKKIKFLIILFLFPFLDTIWNLLMIITAYQLNLTNDFLNLIRIGNTFGLEVYVWVIILTLMIVNLILFVPFYLEIRKTLKRKK